MIIMLVKRLLIWIYYVWKLPICLSLYVVRVSIVQFITKYIGCFYFDSNAHNFCGKLKTFRMAKCACDLLTCYKFEKSTLNHSALKLYITSICVHVIELCLMCGPVSARYHFNRSSYAFRLNFVSINDCKKWWSIKCNRMNLWIILNWN